jgi:hypothetical protein
MFSTKSKVKNSKVKRVKTPTHILLFADSKQEAMRLLEQQNKTLSAFLQEKIDELVRTSKKKEVVYIECPKYESVLPLDPNLNPYNYDYPFETVAINDDQADLSLSFSLRQRLQFDSI